MRHYNRILSLTTAMVLALGSSEICAAKPATNNARTPWNGFFVGGLLGGKIISGKGSITVNADGTDVSSPKDEIVFPLPSHTLTLGFNSEFGYNSTISFGCDFDYGVLPTVKLSYGYLVTPLDRISVGIGASVPLMSTALSAPKGLEISSLFGLTPSISYERALGQGAFFQAQLNYNYLSIKGDNLEKDFKFPVSVKRFIRDYWEKEVNAVKSVDASAHGVTLSLGFGYTF
ncbi:MAG: hypothetical protein I8H80_01700 [Alphaproteobacteria bacterium]|uniref:Outer membrane protein beta-barrel domain-containing protein n=1 Tax=Candidatus Bodocaedibacter vickermanii TaxID=2741701 RepID=A0A7L9RTK5_9PROT|nr:hypothetical protein [Alphaproteobacteria bacterium]QOL19892.1 hypothetical protein CPBP_00663 [Candidatus Paracaedibacteraceae bacterium 'Lake Konstanz']